MFTFINLTQIIINLILAILFVLVSIRYFKIPGRKSRLFGLSLDILAVIQILYLIINAQILPSLTDYQFVIYMLFVGLVFTLLLASTESMQSKLRNTLQSVLVVSMIIVLFTLLISRIASSPMMYELNYLLSFNNPLFLNIFSTILSVCIVLASIAVHSSIKNKKVSNVLEILFLILALAISINLVSSSVAFKLTTTIVMMLTLIAILFVHRKIRLK